MKRTVKGKVYDTKNSELCFFSDISESYSNECVYMAESIWQTRDGDFFFCFDCEPNGIFSMLKPEKHLKRDVKA